MSPACVLRLELDFLRELPLDKLSTPAPAARLPFPQRSFRRNLKEEGVTFEKALDELRHKLAVDYLASKRISVNETAYPVGFSDPILVARFQALDQC